jgi:hypothetical protein
VTIETASFSVRFSVRMCSDFFARPSLSSEAIEPDTSTRNTSADGLRSPTVFAFVATPTRTTWRSEANGCGAASMIVENGEPA